MKIHHIALKVEDLAICEKFYSEILDIPVRDRLFDESGRHRSTWFKLEGAILMLEKSPADPRDKILHTQEGPGWHMMAIAIEKNSRDGWISKLKKNGIAIEAKSRHSLYFRDPEGNLLALSHHPAE